MARVKVTVVRTPRWSCARRRVGAGAGVDAVVDVDVDADVVVVVVDDDFVCVVVVVVAAPLLTHARFCRIVHPPPAARHNTFGSRAPS